MIIFWYNRFCKIQMTLNSKFKNDVVAYIKKMTDKITVLPFYLTLPCILVNVLKLFSFEIILKFSDKFDFYKICYSIVFCYTF